MPQNEGTPAPGDKIGMFFDHGSLDHPLYGKASNLSGLVPLLQPYGSYKPPAIFNEPERLQKLVDSLTPECLELWENELEPQIRARVRDFISIAAFTNPLDDAETPAMQSLICSIIVGFAYDDVLDQLDDISEHGFKYEEIEKLLKFFLDVFDGHYKNIDDMPSPFPAIDSSSRYVWRTDRKMEAAIPNFHERNGALRTEWETSLRCFVLLMEQDPPGEGFSEQSLKLFGGINSGLLLILELVATFRNVPVSKEIRRDVLFHSMKMAIASVSTLMNAIFGFMRDVNLNQVNDSTILRKVVHKGVDLQVAFDECLGLLLEEMNDIRVAVEKLRDRYESDPNLLHYLRLVENLVDGEYYCYAQMTRYGKAGMRVKKV